MISGRPTFRYSVVEPELRFSFIPHFLLLQFRKTAARRKRNTGVTRFAAHVFLLLFINGPTSSRELNFLLLFFSAEPAPTAAEPLRAFLFRRKPPRSPHFHSPFFTQFLYRDRITKESSDLSPSHGHIVLDARSAGAVPPPSSCIMIRFPYRSGIFPCLRHL